jgi:hypothetical protein
LVTYSAVAINAGIGHRISFKIHINPATRPDSLVVNHYVAVEFRHQSASSNPTTSQPCAKIAILAAAGTGGVERIFHSHHVTPPFRLVTDINFWLKISTFCLAGVLFSADNSAFGFLENIDPQMTSIQPN